jgi:hypothetical protein
MVKNPEEYEGDTLSAKFIAISRQVSSASLSGVCAGYCQRALEDASGMTGNAQYISNGRSA